MDKPSRFRPEAEWLEKAERDLKAAEILRSDPEGPLDMVAFHCQQAAEKYLKGCIAFHAEEPEKVHDLVYLLEKCVRFHPALDSLADQADLLSQYAIAPRYPGSSFAFSPEDIHEAIAAAKAIQDAVLACLKG